LVLVNTCSIRDKAEQTVRKRLEKYNAVKRINPKMKVGVLGCGRAFERQIPRRRKIVDLVVGPDAYKDLPNLLAEVEEGRDANQCNFVERRNLWRYFTGSLDEQWHYCFSFHHARL
jgi:tRNA-2-methylthio-N6-dimethylallyladenosine synthase